MKGTKAGRKSKRAGLGELLAGRQGAEAPRGVHGAPPPAAVVQRPRPSAIKNSDAKALAREFNTRMETVFKELRDAQLAEYSALVSYYLALAKYFEAEPSAKKAAKKAVEEADVDFAMVANRIINIQADIGILTLTQAAWVR